MDVHYTKLDYAPRIIPYRFIIQKMHRLFSPCSHQLSCGYHSDTGYAGCKTRVHPISYRCQGNICYHQHHIIGALGHSQADIIQEV